MNMLDLVRLWAVARTEMRLMFRRRLSIIIPVFATLAAIGFLLLTRSQLQSSTGGGAMIDIEARGNDLVFTYENRETGELRFVTQVDAGGLIPRWLVETNPQQASDTLQILSMVGISLMLVLVMMPPMLADVVPFDRHTKTRDLLDTTPLPRWVYLAGKVLGVWISLLIGFAIAGVVFGIAAHVLIGAYYLDVFLRTWVVIIFGCLLVASAVSIIVPALLPTRRTALIAGIALMPLAVFAYVLIIIGLFSVLFSTGEAAYADFTFDALINVGLGQVLRVLAVGTGIAIAAFGGVWAAMRARS